MSDLKVLTDAPTVLRVGASGDLTLGGKPLFSHPASALIARIRELRAAAEPILIVTPNVDQTIDLDRNADFRRAYEEASLRLIDGAPLVLLARLMGARNVHRHTGADLLPLLAKESPREGWTIAVAGGGYGVSDAAAVQLRRAHPESRIVSVPFPNLSRIDDPRSLEVVNELDRISADIVFLCLGAPKQEMWFTHWRDVLPPAVYIGAGAAVDFAAGTARRAPSLVRRAGFEWAWRLAQEPRRLWVRYLVKGPSFIVVACRSLVTGMDA